MAPKEQISWRVATHPILYEAYEGGPFVSAKGIHYPRDCLEIKYVAGNTLLAASDKGQASDSLKQTLTLLPQPRKHDRFMELENRRIKNSLLRFVSAEGSFNKSLNWQPIEDGSGIQINELDSEIMDMVKDTKSPRSSPPAQSFVLAGKEGTFTEGFLKAVSNSQTYEEFRS